MKFEVLDQEGVIVETIEPDLSNKSKIEVLLEIAHTVSIEHGEGYTIQEEQYKTIH